MSSYLGIENRVVLVTGAARGIGKAIAIRLLKESAIVIFSDIDSTKLEETVLGVNSKNAYSMCADVSNQESVSNLFDFIRNKFGKLDCLVNNAGILDISEFENLDYDNYCHVMKVNLDGALLCSLEATPLLKKANSGSILNIVSTMGMFATPNSIPYSTAKAGLISLTRSLALDLAKYKINVNALAPGFISTRMSRLNDGSSEYQTEDFVDVYLKHKRLPSGREGSPEELSGPAVFLLSNDAQYITGQTIVVDGGLTITY